MPAGVAHFLNWIYSSANVFVGAQGKLFWELLALFFYGTNKGLESFSKLTKKTTTTKQNKKT